MYLGLESLGSGAIFGTGTVTAIECLHCALNLPISVVIMRMESTQRLDQSAEAMRTFKPMGQEQIETLLKRTVSIAATGKCERFKLSAAFDATTRHVDWTG